MQNNNYFCYFLNSERERERERETRYNLYSFMLNNDKKMNRHNLLHSQQPFLMKHSFFPPPIHAEIGVFLFSTDDSTMKASDSFFEHLPNAFRAEKKNINSMNEILTTLKDVEIIVLFILYPSRLIQKYLN